MEGYKCPKCYKIGLTTSFISNHFCYIQPIKPIQTIKKIKIKSFEINNNPNSYLLEPER
jgi:hypothetical protein